MNHILAYSGGVTSFVAAKRVKEDIATPTDHIEAVFTDTLNEDEDLYRFLAETIDYLEMPFVHISDGRDIWDVFEDVSFMGNSRVDPCSKHLKREAFGKYLKEHYPDAAATTIHYGICQVEEHRCAALVERWKPYNVRFPLIESQTTKEDSFAILDEIGIEVPRLYEMGFEHNNCGGFCVKTGQKQMLQLLTLMPERYEYHEERQEQLFSRIGNRGFIRKTENGKMRYLSLKEFREMVERGETVQKFPDGACNCFS